jgi:hypothetical protein
VARHFLKDAILCHPGGRRECLLRLCVAMLLNIKLQLMAGDFATCMKTLQRYPPVDVEVITRIAFQLPGVF